MRSLTDNGSTVSTNVWGMDQSGSSCIQVLDNATAMTTTWSWRANETLVHAYPNVNFNPIQRDPIPLTNLSSIDVKVSWSMRPETSTSSSRMDMNGLAAANAMTNVAIDVFFDTDVERAVNTTAPRYEVMVWIGQFGTILPIGATNVTDIKKLPKQKIGKETL
jgi:xyloglucan-specific endo-beta-1,4-glucanase